MKNVRDLMSTDLVTMYADEDLELAEGMMALGRIRHLPILDADDHLVGLITHRDLLRASLSSLAEGDAEIGHAFKMSIPARRVMETDLTTVGPDESIEFVPKPDVETQSSISVVAAGR